jgi:hypothetical protein
MVFAFAAAYVWWIASDLFNLGSDEGIYLEGGRLVAQGRVPYRDFFALTGPLTYWIEGLLVRLAGVNIPVMRLSMVLDLAFMVWAVYWLGARFVGSGFGVGLALVFLAQEAKVHQLVVNHRWDSAALATAAVVAAVAATESERSKLWVVSGALAAAAAWATPTVALVAVPLLLMAVRKSAAGALELVAGGAAIAALGAGYLASQHALGPMIQSMHWTAANYAGANALPYGAILWADGQAYPGGLGWFGWIVRALAAAYQALPAGVPIIALVGWAWRLIGRREEREMRLTLLLGATVALVLSALPRWSSLQLAFVSAVPFALCGILLHRVLPPHWRRAVYAGVMVLAAGPILQKSAAAFQDTTLQTRAGVLAGSPEDAAYLEPLERRIHAGDTLFVFPYLPVLYPLLDAHNPSRYLYLQPGMMTAGDERRAIADLERSPPLWVVTAEPTPAEVLSVWPGSDPSRVPMEAMHAYLQSHYRPVEPVQGKWGPLTILKRK